MSGQQPNPAAYTILSAQYANAANTSAIIVTSEAGNMAISLADTPLLWAKMLGQLTPAAFVAPPPPTPGDIADATITRDTLMRAFVEVFASYTQNPQPRTAAQIRTAIRNAAT